MPFIWNKNTNVSNLGVNIKDDEINKSVYITNLIRTDGFGAQFQTVLWTMLYAYMNNNPYVYTNIHSMDLITNVETIKDNENENTLDEVIEFIAFKNYYSNYSNQVVISKDGREIYNFIEGQINNVFKSQAFLEYKNIFYKNKTSRFDNTHLNVAVHIRRCGLWETENGRFRPGTHDTPNSYYLDKMNLIRNKYSDKSLKFHIYSQGSQDQFKELESDNTVFHLNERTLDTFSDLMFADILVTCASSFSYMAALLSNGEIYYMNFWHPPLEHWNVFHQ